ncbi:hypothetical protein J6590_034057 [Homalodisca vitripennis]|nr:hypothetical protein J6590_034057 [Homalodisca vitripennis]
MGNKPVRPTSQSALRHWLLAWTRLAAGGRANSGCRGEFWTTPWKGFQESGTVIKFRNSTKESVQLRETQEGSGDGRAERRDERTVNVVLLRCPEDDLKPNPKNKKTPEVSGEIFRRFGSTSITVLRSGVPHSRDDSD